MAEWRKPHEKYLLREGHFLGCATGVVLTRWHVWLAIAWLGVCAVLWCKSLISEVRGA